VRQIAICAVIAAALAFAGCGSSSSTGAKPTSSASQIVGKLKAAGLPVTHTVVYTAASDPNHLLGRPNGYTSKASWADSRLGNAVALSAVAHGGSVEVYSSAGGAQARAKYIAGIGARATSLNEYDYVSGSELLRLSAALTPTQAQRYARAIGATLVTAS
jgi:hypothetical protein